VFDRLRPILSLLTLACLIVALIAMPAAAKEPAGPGDDLMTMSTEELSLLLAAREADPAIAENDWLNLWLRARLIYKMQEEATPPPSGSGGGTGGGGDIDD